MALNVKTLCVANSPLLRLSFALGKSRHRASFRPIRPFRPQGQTLLFLLLVCELPPPEFSHFRSRLTKAYLFISLCRINLIVIVRQHARGGVSWRATRTPCARPSSPRPWGRSVRGEPFGCAQESLVEP